MSIHFYASRNNLTGLSDLPSIHSVLKKFGHQTISLLVLLYLIMIKGYSPTYAGIISLGVVLVVSSLRATTRLNFPDIIQCLEKGAINILTLAILMGGVGIVVGSVVISGLGMRFSDLLLSISGGNLPITLILVMIICIVLGMGMPISVAYLVSAMFAAPALIALGVPKLVAHFFVFFFSVSSGLTPPVCLTSIVAAGVAEANWVKTACKAFVFALPIFIVPFMFVFGPQLLMQGSWNAILLAAVTSIIGVVALAGATQGQWFFGTNRWWECIILAFCSVTLLETSLYSDIIGIGGIAIICIAQWLRSKSIIPADNMGN
jgi:TRAP transporter 4TM/12TM fusion protein